jgi:hypothetical protein
LAFTQEEKGRMEQLGCVDTGGEQGRGMVMGGRERRKKDGQRKQPTDTNMVV